MIPANHNSPDAELADLLTRPAPGPSALELSHGMHFDIPEEQYHRKVFGLASKHMLDLIEESPLTYRSYIEAPPEPVDEEKREAFFIGTATGCATLEPERFTKAYACEPDFGYLLKHDASGTSSDQGKENRKRRDDWRAEHKGATFLTPKQWRDVTGMAESVRSHPRIAKLLAAGSHAEVTLRWVDPETDLECKARLDLWVPTYLATLDLKTTQDARAESFAKDCERYGYADQAAMYLDGLQALGIGRGPFLLAAVKKAAPWLRAVYGMDDDWLDSGRRRIRRRLRLMADCVASGRWDGLPDEIQMLTRPRWAKD